MVVVLLTFLMFLIVEMVARVTTVQKDERLSLDLHAFGVLLLELITGQDSLTCDVDQVLVDQVSLHRKCNNNDLHIDFKIWENVL